MKNFLTIIYLMTGLVTYAQSHQYSITAFPNEHIDPKNIYHGLIDAHDWSAIDTITYEWEAVSAIPNLQPTHADYHFGYERKKKMLSLRFPMYQQIGDQCYKVSRAVIHYTKENKDNTTLAKPDYPAHSVLKSGKWYKIGVTDRGIYKIDATLLSQLGISTASVNMRNFRLYGNGGQILSQDPDDDEPTDLIQNAVYITTNGTTLSASDYILFYADGVRTWEYSKVLKRYEHTNNYYSDTAYYYITFDLGLGDRIATESVDGSVVDSVAEYDYYAVIDKDDIHPSTFGKIWLSNPMYSQSLQPTRVGVKLHNPISPVKVDFQLASSMNASTTMDVAANGTNLTTVTFNNNSQYMPVIFRTRLEEYSTTTDTVTFTVTPSTSGTGVAYIDYFRVNHKASLNFAGIAQANFRNVISEGINENDALWYKISGINTSHKIWNVTNKLQPTIVPITLSGTNGKIKGTGGVINEFVIFNGGYKTPKAIGIVDNQDLHALDPLPNIIITHPDFLSIAQQIQAFNNEKTGKGTHIVTVDKIYNEFSSGSQDVAALRNFLRMMYLKTDMPEYALENVLLLGNGSYDYKNRIADNTNFVPVFHSLETGNFNTAFVTDDYLGFLDSAETFSNGSLMDIGVGRIPINNVEEGNIVVKKMYHYHSAQSFGSWKNHFSLLSDNAEGFGFDSEVLYNKLKASSPVYNYSKLYADAYPRVNTPSGNKYPALTSSISNRVFQGTFMMNYLGHGAPDRLASEELVNLDEINKWNNYDKLFLMITGTCDFGRFDNPKLKSGGVISYLKPDGGSIASIITTQIVYANANLSLISKYIETQFNRDASGNRPPLGTSLYRAKNLYNSNVISNASYTLLGNPAMYLALPKYEVNTDSIYHATSDQVYTKTDTLSAGGIYRIHGSIKDGSGAVRTSFSGTVELIVLDKPNKVQIPNPPSQALDQFYTQNSIIFKGKATVKDGLFQFDFVVPKDINYDLGKGKMSYYAYSETEDASGADTNLVVGGFSSYVKTDSDAPIVSCYIDNDRFKDGGVTGRNPLLFVKLQDDNGINVSGSSIGHDLIAIIDGDYANPIILNNYYDATPNDYRSGTVSFLMSGLSPGEHMVTVRAWDVFNNPGEGSVRFMVVDETEGVIGDLYAYPNPVTDDKVTFVLQHNLNNQNLEYTLQIFDAQGRMVKSIIEQVFSAGNRLEIPWYGDTDNGHGIQRGVYLYRMTIKNEQGIQAYRTGKLVFTN